MPFFATLSPSSFIPSAPETCIVVLIKGVDGSEDDPEESRANRRAERDEANGEVEVSKELLDTLVCGGVTKTAQRPLNKSVLRALVETNDASLDEK